MAKKSLSEVGSPTTLPESTPPEYGHTLSTTIEMYRTLGRLEQAIEDLSKQHSEQSKKIDDISKTVHTGKGIVIFASVVLGALGSIAVFLLNKLWNAAILLMQVKPHP